MGLDLRFFWKDFRFTLLDHCEFPSPHAQIYFCIFKIKDEQITVVNVHLTGKKKEDRMQAIEPLLKKLYGVNYKAKIILCGDFHMQPQTLVYQKIISYMQLTSAYYVKWTKEPNYTCQITQEGFFPSDYIFSTASNLVPLKVLSIPNSKENIPNNNPSDHYPVGAIFKFNCC